MKGVDGWEKHDWSDYVRHTNVTSTITGKAIEGRRYSVCPRCDIEHDVFIHGVQIKCKGCGLEGVNFGNSLYLNPNS